MMLIDSRFEQEYIEAKKYCKMSKWNFIGVSLFFLPLSIAMMYVLGHIFLMVIGKEPMNISLFQFIVLSVIIASLLIAMITLEIYFFLTYKRLKNHVKDFTENRLIKKDYTIKSVDIITDEEIKTIDHVHSAEDTKITRIGKFYAVDKDGDEWTQSVDMQEVSYKVGDVITRIFYSDGEEADFIYVNN